MTARLNRSPLEAGERSRTTRTPVLHMLRALILAIGFAPAVFLASPLTADDLYGAPSPGWYNAGSGAYQDQRRSGSDYGPRDDWQGGYGYGRDDVGYATDADRYRFSDPGRRNDGDRRYVDEPAYRDFSDWDPYRQAQPTPRAADPWARPGPEAPERNSPNGYGAPDWAQEPIELAPTRQNYASDRYDDWRGGTRDPYLGPERGYTGQTSPWRAPPERPRYRFRDDPDLGQGVGSTGSDFRFRPLTTKERERGRGLDDDARFADPDRDRRYRPRGNSRGNDDRGTAFGYEPPPDDFYRRYYRAGP